MPTNLLPTFLAMNTVDEDGNEVLPVRRLHPPANGWITNGYAAAFVGDAAASAKEAREGSAEKLELMRAAERIPVVEDIDFRIPFRASTNSQRPKCETCSGTGSRECDLGHDHDCDKCDGDGRLGKRGPHECIGQRVFRATEGREVVAQDRTGAMLDGLDVVWLGGTPESPIGGVDANGDVVVIVMPLRMYGNAATKTEESVA